MPFRHPPAVIAAPFQLIQSNHVLSRSLLRSRSRLWAFTNVHLSHLASPRAVCHTMRPPLFIISLPRLPPFNHGKMATTKSTPTKKKLGFGRLHATVNPQSPTPLSDHSHQPTHNTHPISPSMARRTFLLPRETGNRWIVYCEERFSGLPF